MTVFVVPASAKWMYGRLFGFLFGIKGEIDYD